SNRSGSGRAAATRVAGRPPWSEDCSKRLRAHLPAAETCRGCKEDCKTECASAVRPRPDRFAAESGEQRAESQMRCWVWLSALRSLLSASPLRQCALATGLHARDRLTGKAPRPGWFPGWYRKCLADFAGMHARQNGARALLGSTLELGREQFA